jgi:hypothetical protein
MGRTTQRVRQLRVEKLYGERHLLGEACFQTANIVYEQLRASRGRHKCVWQTEKNWFAEVNVIDHERRMLAKSTDKASIYLKKVPIMSIQKKQGGNKAGTRTMEPMIHHRGRSIAC